MSDDEQFTALFTPDRDHKDHLGVQMAQTTEQIGELYTLVKGLQNDIQKLNRLIIPFHLRILLDLAQQQLLTSFNVDTWEDLQRSFPEAVSDREFANVIHHASSLSEPSYKTLEFICGRNNIRRQGNIAAHQATQEEVRSAVMTVGPQTKERQCLEEMYFYVYGDHVAV